MPNDPVVLRTPPTPSRHRVGLCVIVAVALFLVLAVAWLSDPTERVTLFVRIMVQSSGAALLLALFAWRRFSWITLEEGGIRLSRRWGQDRLVRWADIDHLSIDPPGGPRVPRLNLRNQEQVGLPPLRDEDLPVLREWVRRHQNGEDLESPSD